MKMFFPFQLPLSLSFKSIILFLLLIWLSGKTAFPIQLSAIYFSGCKREVGVFIDVNKSKVQFLNLEGKVISIPRFHISYIAQYPVGKLPIAKVQNHDNSYLVKITTLYQNQPVNLVTGWMIDYGKDRISFLTTNGTDTVIDVNDIWNFQMVPQTQTITFPKQRHPNYRFMHPYPFAHCEKQETGSPKNFQIFPQHLLEEPVLIKTELDRLQKGFDRLESYEKDKKFYPQPQVYNNSVQLHLWGSLGLRHASSKTRNSSFIPSVISQLSEGPYGFQRIWVTGSAPMFYSVHEEPQIQAYYRLKSDFIHFSFNYDVSRLLIGEDAYHWTKDDLKHQDTRWNEKFHVGGGLDYRYYAIDFSITDIEYALRYNDRFFTDSFFLNKFGFLTDLKSIGIDLYYGFGSDEKEDLDLDMDSDSEEEEAYKDYLQEEHDKKPDFTGKFKFARLNLRLKTLQDLKPTYSLIYRSMDFLKKANQEGLGKYRYQSQSITNAVYLSHELQYDLSIKGFLAVEYLTQQYETEEQEEKNNTSYVKGGLSLALTF